jgi:bifunctional ADP-heptose synthase (sugar kinase/adenylyltransferase)
MKIQVLGDPMLDVWTELAAARPNPEQPATPIVRHTRTVVYLGGALNVAQALATIQREDDRRVGDVTFVPTFRFEASEHVRLLPLTRNFILDPTLQASPYNHLSRTRLTRKRRLLIDGKLICRQDEDVHPAVTADVTPRLTAGLLVLTDYAKGSLFPPSQVQAILNRGNMATILLDTKPGLASFLRTAGTGRLGNAILKCNRAEATKAGIDTAASWQRETRARMTIITAGAGGAQYSINGINRSYVPSLFTYYESFPPNVCGAGDIFTAALAAGFARHGMEDVDDLIEYAVDHATRAVMTRQRHTLAPVFPDRDFE